MWPPGGTEGWWRDARQTGKPRFQALSEGHRVERPGQAKFTPSLCPPSLCRPSPQGLGGLDARGEPVRHSLSPGGIWNCSCLCSRAWSLLGLGSCQIHLCSGLVLLRDK